MHALCACVCVCMHARVMLASRNSSPSSHPVKLYCAAHAIGGRAGQATAITHRRQGAMQDTGSKACSRSSSSSNVLCSKPKRSPALQPQREHTHAHTHTSTHTRTCAGRPCGRASKPICQCCGQRHTAAVRECRDDQAPVQAHVLVAVPARARARLLCVKRHAHMAVACWAAHTHGCSTHRDTHTHTAAAGSQ